MKQVFYILSFSVLIAACSIENEPSDRQQANLVSSYIDEDSNLGLYKGVFTTNKSEYRATIQIEIPDGFKSAISVDSEKNGPFPTATLQLAHGEVFEVKATRKVSQGNAVSDLVFASKDLSFTFSVDGNGQNPVVWDVLFKGLESEILIAKHTSRAPVVPVTGVYSCTVCNGHPNLNTGLTQTFNMLFTMPDGIGVITTQSVHGTKMYKGIGVQDNCNPNGLFTSCDITSGNGVTNVGYLSNGNPVTWMGVHSFNNEPSANGNDCSFIQGTWQWQSNGYGLLSGIFVSDNDCFETLYFEDFNTFNGNGFSSTPASGQLDSEIIIVKGLSDGDLNFGDTGVSGDYARGSSTEGVSTGGVYAFNIAELSSGAALGVQPIGSDFTPGSFEFKVLNQSGNMLTNLRVSYDIFANNNTDRSSSLNFSYSTDGTNFIHLPDLDFISPEVSPATGGFPPEFPVFSSRSSLILANIPIGGFIYLKFTGDDVSGSGSRDEFLIDNVLLEGF